MQALEITPTLADKRNLKWLKAQTVKEIPNAATLACSMEHSVTTITLVRVATIKRLREKDCSSTLHNPRWYCPPW
jgi:hypothetical protein